MEPPS